MGKKQVQNLMNGLNGASHAVHSNLNRQRCSDLSIFSVPYIVEFLVLITQKKQGSDTHSGISQSHNQQ